ncbi:MAG: ATP-binding cassette domain-containing protein [Geitlerinemataceae cyanobacterium]
MTPPLLQLDRVSLTASLGNRPLLTDISFQLHPGDRCALLGASGSGKTQLLRLCNRLNEASSGQIRFDGRSLQDWPVQQYRQTATLVLQESSLLGQSVERAIAYPLELRGLKPAIVQQRVNHWCDRLKLSSEWMRKTEAQLSVGQRQWVAIARALATEPKLLLLDEPTSALDAGRSDRLVRVLTDLAATGTAIVFVTHQFDVARAFANRLLYLRDGQLDRDVPADGVDWEALKTEVIEAERQQAAEWE